MTSLPGVSGSLFPSRYLASGFVEDVQSRLPHSNLDHRRQRMLSWWRGVEARCGPATGLRALFDLLAMPLAGQLGYRAKDAAFERTRAAARLETRHGAIVALMLVPWASSPSLMWRELAATTRAMGGRWCLLIAPPFVSVVDVHGSAVRRSLDFRLPEALDHRSFLQFWTLTHATAFDNNFTPQDRRDTGAVVAPAAIELLIGRAAAFQDRVREDLQLGVVRALAALTPALGRRPAAARSSRFDEALTLIYRILFLLFAESRDLVPRRHPVYGRAYALSTLCRDALGRNASVAGLWEALAAITRLSRRGCRTDDLIVRPFNGRLFARAAAPSLESAWSRGRGPAAGLRDGAMGRALISLATRQGRGGHEEISYVDLGVEQLGAVYERVLDLDRALVESTVDPPRSHAAQRPKSPRHSARRKETGTFYTPQPLAEFVVRRTLAPLVRGASSDAILSLRVVDPAMGSGAFLVAACRYLAAAYQHALVDEGRCAASDLDDEARANARRLIAERCLAGVDANPVAVQLARLSLWLTALARGKPLGFVDHRLRVGNSLVGASPDDLWRAGDRLAQRVPEALPLFDAANLESAIRQVAPPLAELTRLRDDTVDEVRTKEAIWNRIAGDGSPLDPWRLACSLWCARWFWPVTAASDDHTAPPSGPELRAALDAILKRDRTLDPLRIERWCATARSIALQLRFFHWPLEFADVFYDDLGQPRARPGFDAVIGNPPWEMLRNDAHSRERKGGTAECPNPGTHEPRNPGTSEPRHLIPFIRQSGLYPSCHRGHVNLYQPFLERALSIARPGGRVGLILPWGLASDDGASALREALLTHNGLDTIVGLDNSAGLFPIHRGLRFLVIVSNRGRPPREIVAQFGVRTAEEISALPDCDEPGPNSAFPVRLTADLVRLVGGRERRIPHIRRRADLDWLERLARAFPPLGSPSGWTARFSRELNATEDRADFGPIGLQVIEGKHLSPFVTALLPAGPRIPRGAALRLLPDARFDRPRLAYRDVSGVANRVSLIAAVLPGGVLSTHTVFCLRTPLPLLQQHFLCGLFNSYILNAIVRMFMGSHVTTSLVENLPVPPWSGAPRERRIARLAARLARVPASARPAATLQAGVARLYDCDEDTFARLLESFPLVDRTDREMALEVFRDMKDMKG